MNNLLPFDVHAPHLNGITIVRSFDVPYLAGASKDGRTVYIDRRVPRQLAIRRAKGTGYAAVDVGRFLAEHEIAEWRAMQKGVPYEKAHIKDGTVAEREAVKAAGLNWDHYERVMDGLLAHIEHEKVRKAPPDLYLKPYPHNKRLILERARSRQQGGAVDALSDAADTAADTYTPNDIGATEFTPEGIPLVTIHPHGAAPNPPPTSNSVVALDFSALSDSGNSPTISTQSTQTSPRSPIVPPSPPGPGGGSQTVTPSNPYPSPVAPRTPINGPTAATTPPVATPTPVPNEAAVAPPTAESAPEPVHNRSILDKLLGIGGPRYELWPERVIRSALTAPGEAYQTGELTERNEYGQPVAREPVGAIMQPWTPPTTQTPREGGIWPFNEYLAPAPNQPGDLTIQRAQDVAAMQFSGGAGAAEEGALGMAGGKPPRPIDIPKSNIPYEDLRNEYINASGYEDPQRTEVPISQLRATQETISPDTATSVGPIKVIKTNDGLYHIVNGHNRVGAAMAVGRSSIPVDYYDAGQYPGSVLQTEAGKPGAALAALEHPFYSAVERAVANAPQNKMTADQWINWLKNQPGVKPEELYWRNLEDKSQLAPELQNGPVTKDQLLNHLKENDPVQLQMVEKSGDPGAVEYQLRKTAYIQAREEMEREFVRKYPYSNSGDFRRYLERNDDEYTERAGEIYDQLLKGVTVPRYFQYQLPGGEDYRETLVTLPSGPEPSQEMRTAVDKAWRESERPNLTAANWGNVYFPEKVADQLVSQGKMTPENRAVIANYGTALRKSLPSYMSTHWAEPNPLLHLRMNDRRIPGVGKTLHLEELQSDWHHAGWMYGYKGEPITDVNVIPGPDGRWRVVDQNDHITNLEFPSSFSREQALLKARTALQQRDPSLMNNTRAVPQAPFKTSWPDLGLKIAIAKAARKGYDSISWTPGEQQAERYNLSKQVDAIRYNKNADGTYRVGADQKGGDSMIALGDSIPEAKLADYVGKDVADKIVKGVGEENPHGGKILSGLDLKVGEEGKKRLYNQTFVNKANAIGKKYGAHVEWKDLPLPAYNQGRPISIKQALVRWNDLDNRGYDTFSASDRNFYDKVDPFFDSLKGDEISLIERGEAPPELLRDFDKLGLEPDPSSIKVPVLKLTPQLKKAAFKGLPLFSEAGKPAAPLSALENTGLLKPSELTRVGPQMGSNPGGVFKDKTGARYYVKEGYSPDHVKNEYMAADLYKLAGTPTLKYVPVEGGNHIATRMEPLEKNNAVDLSYAEIKKAQKDFAAHAWLANWDVIGSGGDNLGVIRGHPTALDLGGALKYRARGAPKGKAFSNTVGELQSLRNPDVNPYGADVFGGMSDADLIASMGRVARVPDEAIKEAVTKNGGSPELAQKLIARKNYIASQIPKEDPFPFGLGVVKTPRGDYEVVDRNTGRQVAAGLPTKKFATEWIKENYRPGKETPKYLANQKQQQEESHSFKRVRDRRLSFANQHNLTSDDLKLIKRWLDEDDNGLYSSDRFAKILKKLPRYSGVVYRGLSLPPEVASELVSGKTFTLQRHVSASQSRKIARFFADESSGDNEETSNVLFTIKQDSGRGFGPFNYEWGDEQEVVLPKGTKYQIESVTPTQRKGAKQGGYLITAKELPSSAITENGPSLFSEAGKPAASLAGLEKGSPDIKGAITNAINKQPIRTRGGQFMSRSGPLANTGPAMFRNAARVVGLKPKDYEGSARQMPLAEYGPALFRRMINKNGNQSPVATTALAESGRPAATLAALRRVADTPAKKARVDALQKAVRNTSSIGDRQQKEGAVGMWKISGSGDFPNWKFDNKTGKVPEVLPDDYFNLKPTTRTRQSVEESEWPLKLVPVNQFSDTWKGDLLSQWLENKSDKTVAWMLNQFANGKLSPATVSWRYNPHDPLDGSHRMFAAHLAGLKYYPAFVEPPPRINRASGGRVESNPSQAQIEAGNYKKDHIVIHDLPISVENPKGSIRRGVHNGKSWEVKMPAHYGYFKRTEGVDGDHIDVYVGPHPKSPKAFIIDQQDADTKKFDEHKVLLGFGSKIQALATYHKGFSDGRGSERVHAIHELTIPELKTWLNGVTKAVQRKQPITVLSANGVHPFEVEVASTDAERKQGLMGVKELPVNEGMLFDLKKPRPVWFTMRNTFLPLDMLFIGDDGRVNHIATNTKPQSSKPILSNGPARAVLELNGGTTAKQGIKIGDLVAGSIFPSVTNKITRAAFSYKDRSGGGDHCYNCRYTSGSDNGCGLYRMLNQRQADDFELDPAVAPAGYCKAHTPRGAA